jgi:hypothetical protein
MDIGKLFNGIAVIVDDEINTSGTTISVIKTILENKKIPVVVYEDLPPVDIIPALSNASFIILDWEYKKKPQSLQDEERITIPDTLLETQESNLMEFIKKLISTIFVPVFIFSYKTPDSIKDKLRTAHLWDEQRANRIFIKQKNEIQTEEGMFQAIEEWLKAMPSAYVLKEWETKIAAIKNEMFLELYSFSPNWAKIIWDLLKEDTKEFQKEFGDFVTKNLMNRIDSFSFDENIIDSEVDINSDELRRVIQGERYLFYTSQPDQVYTGDLFKDGNSYYLNIRAQCDLARGEADGKYNPTIYCIKGKKLCAEDITGDEIKLTNENQLVIGTEKCFSLDDLKEICQDEVKLLDFNKKFVRYRNKIFFRKGNFLERTDKVIIGCVAEEQAIQFSMDLMLKTFEEIRGNRIGRILPPYITRIQQKCAQNMIREGVMPIPKELFSNFNG